VALLLSNEYLKNKVERRPVIRIGVPDTIVTIDNRETTLATIVKIARTDNQTETGSLARATILIKS
jgi:hypothetical protein